MNQVVGAVAAANPVGAAARVAVTNEAAAVVLGVVLGTEEVVVAAPALRFTGVSMRIKELAAQMLTVVLEVQAEAAEAPALEAVAMVKLAHQWDTEGHIMMGIWSFKGMFKVLTVKIVRKARTVKIAGAVVAAVKEVKETLRRIHQAKTAVIAAVEVKQVMPVLKVKQTVLEAVWRMKVEVLIVVRTVLPTVQQIVNQAVREVLPSSQAVAVVVWEALTVQEVAAAAEEVATASVLRLIPPEE